MVVLVSLTGFLFLAFLGLLIVSEVSSRRFYPILPELPRGLVQSLRYGMELDPRGRVPRLLVFQNPLPVAFALRSLGGSGAIYLSQGLICQFNEDELRQTIKGALQGLNSNRAPFESVCWLMSLFLTRSVSAAWIQLNFSSRKLSKATESKLSPLSTLVFWILYPLITFCARHSQARMVQLGSQPGDLALKRKMIWSYLLSGLLSGSFSSASTRASSGFSSALPTAILRRPTSRVSERAYATAPQKT